MATPRATTYNAESGDGVFAGVPRPPGFASGPDAGTLVGDLWTPGKSAGVVNAASWAIVPTGRWITVTGSNPDATQAIINAAIPGWSSFAPNTYWPDWWGSWSSITALPNGTRCWYMGGGHSNGSNNSIIEFDAYRMAWSVIAMPSDPAAWSTAYKAVAGSGSTNYPESVTAQQAKQTAGTLAALNDVSADETQDTPPKPTARHTYQGLLVVPEKNWLLVMRQRMWRLNLSTGQWVQRRRLFDEVARGAVGDSGGAGANYLDAENVLAVYDEAAGIVTATSQGSTYGGNGRAVRYNVNTEAWIDGSSTGYDSPWQRNAQFYVTKGRERWFFAMPVSNVPSGASGHDGWTGKLNLDTGVFTQTATEPSSGPGFTYGGGLSRASFRKLDSYYDGQGGVYVPPIDKVWATQWDASAVNTLYEIDIATWPPTISLAPTNGTPPTLQNYSKGKGVFVAPINAVLWFGQGNGLGSIYRFPE
jgi:hypothetical protein